MKQFLAIAALTSALGVIAAIPMAQAQTAKTCSPTTTIAAKSKLSLGLNSRLASSSSHPGVCRAKSI